MLSRWRAELCLYHAAKPLEPPPPSLFLLLCAPVFCRVLFLCAFFVDGVCFIFVFCFACSMSPIPARVHCPIIPSYHLRIIFLSSFNHRHEVWRVTGDVLFLMAR